MFTRSERNLLQEALNNGERIGRRLVEDNDCSMGCIELHLSARERVHAFIEQFGLRLVSHDDFPVNALSGVLLPLSQMQFIRLARNSMCRYGKLKNTNGRKNSGLLKRLIIY